MMVAKQTVHFCPIGQKCTIVPSETSEVHGDGKSAILQKNHIKIGFSASFEKKPIL